MTPSPAYQRTIDALAQAEDERRKAEAERDQLREDAAMWSQAHTAAIRERDRYRAALEAVAHAEKDVPGSVAGMIANRALRGDPTEAPPICLLPDCDLPLRHEGDHVIHLANPTEAPEDDPFKEASDGYEREWSRGTTEARERYAERFVREFPEGTTP